MRKLRRPLLFALYQLVVILKSAAQQVTPVVGVFSEPWYHHVDCRHNHSLPKFCAETDGTNYIAASYQKWLEVAGLRSIPIPYDAPQSLLDAIFDEINALFLPGGGSRINHAVSHMLDRALRSNQNDGVFFPVWGTCLGFEHLVEFFGGRHVLEDGYASENVSLPLEQVDGAASQLYNDTAIYDMVTTRNITLNNHRSGIRPATFQASAMLSSNFVITSTNVDAYGRPFVSTLEPRQPQRLPFYGVQYHPEKNLFEYGSYNGSDVPFEAIAHGEAARYFSFHLAQFWGRIVRRGQESQCQQAAGDVRSCHQYSGKFPVLSSYPTEAGIGFEQVYLIPSAANIMEQASILTE